MPRQAAAAPPTPEAKRRGTKPGTKQERNFEHVCAQCGVTFMGTARAVFCSRACNLRAWRARQAKSEATP